MPDDADAFINRGNARQDCNDLEGAIADYDEAIRLDPDNAFALNNRGTARCDKGDLEGALADYNEAIRLQPDYANAFYNRAELFERKTSYPAAIADFQKYLDHDGGVQAGNQVEVEQRISDLRKKLATEQEQTKPNKSTKQRKTRGKKK
jgi:tetratricopeptide (TPR) repeat protein